MPDIKIYKQKDLVLKVNQNYDPAKLDLDAWEPFLNNLCTDREYQKEAIRNSVIFLASGKYAKTKNLVEENYKKNTEMQTKYHSLADYQEDLQLPNKLFANIDLATGTGKSYVIYGIAQIMLGLDLIDKVLVLCPSLTIEDGLIRKFEELSGNAELKKSIPEGAKYKNPSVVNANVTVKNGNVCVENIHAVYERTGSSIDDSFKGEGKRVLVLNDESHHIFNKISGNSDVAKGLNRWKEFLLNPDFDFKYILGFTGTAYHGDEYFNDVIYRYSLREAIEEKIVKKIAYVQKDDSSGVDEKFQKIYQNHEDNHKKYSKIKPLSIMITKDIKKAEELYDDFLDFLVEKKDIPRERAREKILIVTSDKAHKANLPRLRMVDEKDDPTEWIISVSMLTEGWDVKNVFQIVPWEDRAFNSKLLIAQVLGRGLRVPEEYNSPQPQVVVFNHDTWSRNIKSLVDEVLEIETRIKSQVIKNGERTKYNFDVYNLDYTIEEVPISQKPNLVFNYSRMEKEGIKLDSQVTEKEKETSYESAIDGTITDKSYRIKHNTWLVEEVVDKIYEEFKNREWEGKTLKLSEGHYTQNNLPPKEKIEEIIRKSMDKVGIKGDKLVDKNATFIFNAFATLLRKTNKTIIPKRNINNFYLIRTINISEESIGIGNLRRDCSLFYTDEWENEIADKEQKIVLRGVVNDETLPRKAMNEINNFLFRAALSVVITSSEPERMFVRKLCQKDVAEKIESWLKSRDKGFYQIEYSLRYGSKQSKTRAHSQKTFNPDFFVKIKKDDTEYFLVVEIKADGDDSRENKAKYKYAKEHFEQLNEKLEEEGIKQKYIFHFLSPNGYAEFFDYMKDGRILIEQSKFRCELENLLEKPDEE